jgi:hypothetical protein
MKLVEDEAMLVGLDENGQRCLRHSLLLGAPDFLGGMPLLKHLRLPIKAQRRMAPSLTRMTRTLKGNSFAALTELVEEPHARDEQHARRPRISRPPPAPDRATGE